MPDSGRWMRLRGTWTRRGRPCADGEADRLGQLLHQRTAGGAVGVAVGGDHPLVDPPGGFDFDVRVGCEQRLDPRVLLLSEREPTSRAVPRRMLTPTRAAPRIRLSNTRGQHGPAGLQIS